MLEWLAAPAAAQGLHASPFRGLVRVPERSCVCARARVHARARVFVCLFDCLIVCLFVRPGVVLVFSRRIGWLRGCFFVLDGRDQGV